MVSDRFEDDVAVGGGVSGADEADGLGDEALELDVGEAGDFELGGEALEAVESGIIGEQGFRGIGGEKLLGLPDAAHFEVGVEESEEIGDEGDALGEGEVDRFDFVPVGEGPIGDDEGVGVPDAGEEFEEIRIEDAGLDHKGETLSYRRRLGRKKWGRWDGFPGVLTNTSGESGVCFIPGHRSVPSSSWRLWFEGGLLRGRLLGPLRRPFPPE
jgi:hypothetical protein